MPSQDRPVEPLHSTTIGWAGAGDFPVPFPATRRRRLRGFISWPNDGADFARRFGLSTHKDKRAQALCEEILVDFDDSVGVTYLNTNPVANHQAGEALAVDQDDARWNTFGVGARSI